MRVPPGQEESGRTVAAAFAGAQVIPDEDVTEVVVELGSGAPALQEVPNRLGTDPLPDPTDEPAPESSIEVRAATDDICAT